MSSKAIGIVHGWIQTRFINGERVTWGSDDVLQGAPLTVRELEDLARRLATVEKRWAVALVKDLGGGKIQLTCSTVECESRDAAIGFVVDRELEDGASGAVRSVIAVPCYDAAV